MGHALLLVIALTLLSSLPGCSSKGEATTGKAVTAKKKAVAVDALKAETSMIIEGVDVVGSLSAKVESEVKSQIPGLVSDVYVTEGVRVRKNAPLARIEVSEIQVLVKKAQAAVKYATAARIQAEVAAKRAERERARMLKQKEYGLATQQSLDDAETEAAASVARVEAAAAQISAAREDLHQAQSRLSKGLILSPMDGIVYYRDVNVGDLTSETGAAKPLFRIVDNSVLNLAVTVPSVDMAAAKVGNSLTFTVDALPGKMFYGRVKFVNPVVERTDRSVKVIAEVVNRSGELKGGLFVKGRLLTGIERSVIQVPRSALMGLNFESKKAGLYIVEGDRSRYRSVATGVVSGDLVEIVSGLKPGERFVVRGGFNLKDGETIVASERVVK
jgi:membrane fusion protein, multidrug efflux system